MTAAVVRRSDAAVATLRPATAVLLHLGPGVLALLGYLALLPVADALGLPSVAALAGSGLLVIPAVQGGLLLAARRRRPTEPVLGLRARLPLAGLLSWALLEVVLAGAAFLVTAPLTSGLQSRLFGWWPDAWSIGLGTDGGYSDGAVLVTAGLLLVGSVLVAPVVEELYFRGYLLPRMPQTLGGWRVPVHVVLFAAYHLWSLWLAPTRVLAILPLAYIAVRTRDVRIGIVTHVVLNATDLVALLIYLSTR